MHSHLQITAFLCFLNETISGYRRMAFSLCTEVCEKKKRNEAKQCFVFFAKRKFPKRYMAFFVVFFFLFVVVVAFCFHIT